MKKVNFKGSVMLNPTPVVLVTSKNKEDKVNAFTVGWVSTVCTKPPMIAMGIRPERLSHEYIKESKECVINLPCRDMVKFVDFCGVKSGRKVDKIKHFGYALDKGIAVSTPSIDESLIDEKGKIHFNKANLLAYSHGEYFGLNSKPLGSFGYSIKKKKKSR